MLSKVCYGCTIDSSVIHSYVLMVKLFSDVLTALSTGDGARTTTIERVAYSWLSFEGVWVI